VGWVRVDFEGTRFVSETEIDLVELARSGAVHFVGIGGAGMAPLAEMLLLVGGRVTGCQDQLNAAARLLEARGATVVQGHDPAHVQDSVAVVMTAAVPDDHPEIAAARARGIPVLKRAKALGAIVNHGTVVGIAGTHGKTTTTTLTTTVLAAAGLEPTGFVGARVPAWGGNLRRGKDEVYVVEADEYDRSFHQLRPSIAVVTTLEADHLDIYGSLEAVEEAFLIFAESVPDSGMIACCADDHGAARLANQLRGGPERVMTYGLNAGSMLRAEEVDLYAGGGAHFTVRERGRRLGRATLHAPGVHNVRNALAAVAVARRLGVEWPVIERALGEYSGVERRFEWVGQENGVTFIDDYAHHPTEVAATLLAARAAHPGSRLVAVFQPHLYSRTRDFAPEFGLALATADVVFLTDVYAAREKPIDGVTGEMIAAPAREAGADVRYVPQRADVVDAVAAELRRGDLCLTMGAGNLDEAARDLLVRARAEELAVR
jgi:UDP-N-acetylmuramate--alanine ligase